MSQKEEEFDHTYHHKCMHNALKVNILRDESGTAYEFQDVEPYQYNIYRGYKHGEGHADRLLDDYLCRTNLKAELPACGCADYRVFLQKERKYYCATAPQNSLRARLLKSA